MSCEHQWVPFLDKNGADVLRLHVGGRAVATRCTTCGAAVSFEEIEQMLAPFLAAVEQTKKPSADPYRFAIATLVADARPKEPTHV